MPGFGSANSRKSGLVPAWPISTRQSSILYRKGHAERFVSPGARANLRIVLFIPVNYGHAGVAAGVDGRRLSEVDADAIDATVSAITGT